jgi:hypothetical protein
MVQAMLDLAKHLCTWKGTLTKFLELIAESTGCYAFTIPGWPKTPALKSSCAELPLNCARSVYPSPSIEAREPDESSLLPELPVATRPECTPGKSAAIEVVTSRF